MAVQKKKRDDKSCGRSRVTNGRSYLPKEVDGRSFYSRRLRDLIALHTADLGGAANLSAAEQAIVRRAAVIMIALEKMELQFALVDAEGVSASDLDLYQRLSNSLRRLLREVGIKRRARDVTPDLQTYLRQKAAERDALTIDYDDDEPRLNGHHRVRA
jgi:hypothetical protein